MAYSYQDPVSGATLIVPDSAISISTNVNVSANSTTGVLAIVGEADAGPSFSQDGANGSKLSANSFSPGDINQVLAKYKSGRLVDAFLGAVAAYSAGLTASFNRIILVKTNDSNQASMALSTGGIVAKIGGLDGNNIQLSVATSTLEKAPTTGDVSYVPQAAAQTLQVRVNGEVQQSLAIPANSSPAALVAAMSNFSDVLATGGVNRDILAGLVGQSISMTVSGQTAVIKLQLGQVFATAPKIGDTVSIPAGSVLQGGASQNIGYYLVTAFSNTNSSATISVSRLNLLPMAAVVSSLIAATTDLSNLSYIKLSNVTGSDKQSLATLVGSTASVSVAGSILTFTLQPTKQFSAQPAVGDTFQIPSGSAFAGAGAANVGYYEVLSVNNTAALAEIKAARISNGLPITVASTVIASVNDAKVVSKQIPGVSKSLEITDGGGAGALADSFFVLGTQDPASFIDEVIESSAEMKKTIQLKNVASGVQEAFTVGGTVFMKLSYEGTTATATISVISGKLTFTTSVIGGSGGNLSIDLTQINSIGQLVSVINQNPGYKAVAVTASAAQQNPNILDQISAAGIATSVIGATVLGIKADNSQLKGSTKGLGGSTLAFYNDTASSGLPNDLAPSFLMNGIKGATSGLEFANAVNALAGVRCNFVIPLVSQDASEDFIARLTDVGSSYQVDAVNEAVKAHCLSMSTAKIKRHRLGIVSKRGSFNECVTAAQNMASARIAMAFQDVSTINSQGSIVSFQPWMGAVKAASMQASAQYRGIFGPRRVVNVSNVTTRYNDFDDENMTALEDALLAGLLPLSKNEQGAYNWSSDQTTYSIPDNNYIYNSLQGMYTGDLIALNLAESLKNAFIGESNADVTEAVAINFIKQKMNEYLNNKWTAPSGSFLNGWKSITVKINGPVMSVSACVIESSALKFIVIDLTLEGVSSSSGGTASGRSF